MQCNMCMPLFPAVDITDVICADVMRAPTKSDAEPQNRIREKNATQMGRPAQQGTKNDTEEYIQRSEKGEAGKGVGWRAEEKWTLKPAIKEHPEYK